MTQIFVQLCHISKCDICDACLVCIKYLATFIYGYEKKVIIGGEKKFDYRDCN